MANTFVVEREQRIEGSAAAVFERIVDFRRWQSWEPWAVVDPGLHRNLLGADSGVGAIYEWIGNRKAGAGRMEITSVEPDRSVTIAVRFVQPFKSKSTAEFTLEPDGATTVVRWTLTGPKTLWIRFFGTFTSMDRVMGGDFETGLTRLKDDVERSGS